MMKPLVSVITTVYNCERYISESIESILNQTNENFEYLIVDDGSTDNTGKILKEYSKKDDRLIIIDNSKNMGRVRSLNSVLEIAKGKFIALQDADDVSLPHRLEKQVKFLEKNHEYVLVGSDVTVVDGKGNAVSNPVRPECDHEIKFSLLFRCTFANPSIMFKKETAYRNKIWYEDDFQHSEDFRFISHISRHGKIHNLSDKLIFYRKHETNNSSVNSKILNKTSTKIVKDNLGRLGFDISDEKAERLRKLMSSRGIDKDNLFQDVKLLFEIIKKFRKKFPSGDNKEVSRILKKMTGWLGKKNVLSKGDYRTLYFSILTYYSKEFIFNKKFPRKSSTGYKTSHKNL